MFCVHWFFLVTLTSFSLSAVFLTDKVYGTDQRKEGIGFYVAFNSLYQAILRWDRNPEPERNFLLSTNSSKGSFSCRRITDSPPQRCTFIKRPGQPTYGDPVETQICDLACSILFNPFLNDPSAELINYLVGAEQPAISLSLHTELNVIVW